MKDYIDQFYNEGLATIFYLKPINFIKKSIKNTKVNKFLVTLIKILYTILVLIFAVYMFFKKYPL